MSGDKSMLGRRQFLGAGLAAAVTSGVANVEASAPAENAAKKTVKDLPYNPRTYRAMPTRNLGKTGYQVGILSLGGQATIEREGTDDESIAIVNRAVNYIDAAAACGGGISETHIGYVMKDRRSAVAQIEEDVHIASEFTGLNEEQMAKIEYKTLPIVRQGLYFRRWDLGA